MATYSRDLEKQMQQYIDAEETASLEFRKLLQSTTAEIRYKLLMEVRGVKYRETTGVFNAAYIRDLPGAKCMLDGMSEEQKFNTLKIADSNGFTPLHAAVNVQSDHPYSSEVPKELTNNLSAEQLYQLLEMKTKESKSTVLHFAVYYNRVDFVPRILAPFTRDQKYKLLSTRTAAGATPADLSVTTIFSTVQVVAEQKNELAVQKNEQAVQKNELAVHKNELAVQKNELAEQKNELAEQGKGLREAQQTIETVNRELVIQGTVQSQLSDRCKELEAERAQELNETKKALVDLQTTSDVEKERLQKRILQMEQNMLEQTEGLEETKKELADVQKSNNELVGELLRRNMLLERDNNQQTQALQDTRDELDIVRRSSQRQIDRLQEKNDEQEQVIQVMTARQSVMEQMLDRLELEFRRPIVTDETGDQENEDY